MAFISNGTTILDNGAFSVGLGSLVLISEQTASGSASIEFTTGIDSTYPIYKFEWINIHPSTDANDFTVNFSTDSGSNYNVVKTTTNFNSYHNESDTATILQYISARDLAQSTNDQKLNDGVGSDNDQSTSGHMYLFNPSSSVFVKHFMSCSNQAYASDYTINDFIAGYCNTTSPINAVRFRFDDPVNNTESGTIKLYGIKDS